MTRIPIALLFAALTTLATVTASGLQIAGAYYDPIQAESGGEAIQLVNNGSTPTPLDSVTLATKSGSFTLPSTTLLPGQGYLIADTDWSTLRDNLSWPEADVEFGLTLANTAAYVELLDADGDSIDRLDWNASFKAREGYMLTPHGEARPAFTNSRTAAYEVPASIIVQNAGPTVVNVTVTDDAPTAGVQWLSYGRTIAVTAVVRDLNGDNMTVDCSFHGSVVSLHFNHTLNATDAIYMGTFVYTPIAPGEYPVIVDVSDGESFGSLSVPVTILSSASITTSGSLVFSGAPSSTVSGSFTVANEGNIIKTVTLQQSIPGASCDTTMVVLDPGESKDITCTVTIPQAAAGRYEYLVRLLAS